MLSDEKPDLLHDLQCTCRKLEAAILECERMLKTSPLVLADRGVLQTALDRTAPDAQQEPSPKVQR